MTKEELQKIDQENIWHPFTQTTIWQAEDPLIISRASGVELIDVEGRHYLDGISSLWCNVHGHGVPELVEAIKVQADKLCHSTLLGLSHQPVIELTEKLLQVMPKNLSRVFYSDSGSAAVEAALRMALEWWNKQSTPAAKKKNRIVSLQGSYHGDTLGAVSLGYLGQMHHALKDCVFPVIRVTPPHLYRQAEGLEVGDAESKSLEDLEKVFIRESASIAAMIIEPLVQGAAGIWVQSVSYLQALARLCKKYEVLLIADEISTGFGKTGKMFAVDQMCTPDESSITPDIIVLGKGLGAGYLPISAAVTTEAIFQGFSGAVEELKTFYYGQTFSGNALAASVAKVSLELFEKNNILENLTSKIAYFKKLLEAELRDLEHVQEIRQWGVMVGVELVKDKDKKIPYQMGEMAGHQVIKEARKRGVIIRPLGNVVVLMPCLAMKVEDLEKLVKVTRESIIEALSAR